MRISDWSSDVCSSDLQPPAPRSTFVPDHDPLIGHCRFGYLSLYIEAYTLLNAPDQLVLIAVRVAQSDVLNDDRRCLVELSFGRQFARAPAPGGHVVETAQANAIHRFTFVAVHPAPPRHFY